VFSLPFSIRRPPPYLRWISHCLCLQPNQHTLPPPRLRSSAPPAPGCPADLPNIIAGGPGVRSFPPPPFLHLDNNCDGIFLASQFPFPFLTSIPFPFNGWSFPFESRSGDLSQDILVKRTVFPSFCVLQLANVSHFSHVPSQT